MAKIPKFRSLEEAADFWDSHDFEDYIDATHRVSIAVRIPRRQKTLAISVGPKTYEKIRALAAKRGVPPRKLVSSWLTRKATEEFAAH